MSSSPVANLENFLIPLEVIESATEKFLINNEIAWGEYSKLYKVQLSESWGNRTVAFKRFIRYRCDGQKEFLNELKVISISNHENIISFLGYSDEGKDNIVVYGYPANGSLASYLGTPNERSCLTWQHRLGICLDAAKGLNYLHSGLGQHGTVIHGSLMAENILLDDNLKAKICGFEMSELIPGNQPCKQVYKPDEERLCELIDLLVHKDPIYLETGFLNVESDIFSFGVLLFKILTWPEAFERVIGIEDRVKNSLTMKIQHQYHNKLDSLIDPAIRDQIGSPSFHMIEEIACKCISYNIKERPTMDTVVKKIQEALDIHKHKAIDSTITTRSLNYEKLEDLLIPLKEIKSATSEFSEDSKIGNGGFGVVYKGRLSESWTKHEAAFKRLKKTSDKDKTEFLKELKLISMFHHQNIIRLIGYCDDDDEMILVSEYAVNGSLDDHLEDPKKRRLLSWNKRLKICLGAAKGLDHLHSGLGEDKKVIHRDVKSGNILLDDNFEAKICDFGLSKSDLTYDHQHSKCYTGVAGTDYYMDPIYHESGILRTESDVYSFGVVMFEMLMGMPAWHVKSFGRDKPQPLINLVRRYYDYGKDLLIDPQIKSQIDKNSFHTFIEIAYQCISFNSKERPTMEKVADKIEEALDFQVQKDASSKVIERLSMGAALE